MIGRLSVSLFVAIGLVGLLFGEEGASGSGADIDQLQNQITALQDDTTVPEVSRDAAISNYRDAIGYLEKKEQFEKREAEYRTALSEGALEIRQMQAEAATLQDPDQPSELSDRSEMSQIEEALAKEQMALSKARSTLNEIETKQGKSSPAIIGERMIAAQAELDEVEASLQESNASGGDTVDLAKKKALQSHRDSLVAEIRMLEQESLSYDIRSARSEASGDLEKQRIASIENRIQAIEELAKDKVNSSLDRAAALVRRVKKSAPSVNSAVSVRLDELERLISESRRVSDQFEDTAARLRGRQTLLEKITEDFANVKRQISIGGLEGSFARILLERRRTLPRPLDERRLLGEIRQDLTEAQRALYFLENESLNGSGNEVEMTSPDTGEDGGASAIPQNEVSELGATRERLRQDLIASYQRLIRNLNDLDLVERQIDQESAKYREFLAEQLFWERSSPLIGVKTFRAISPGLVWSFGPKRAKEFVDQFSEFPMGFYVVLAVILSFLIGLRGKFKAELEASGNRTRRISTDNYLNTVKAFILTILLALPLPLALVVFGTAFRVHREATEWSFGIGTAFLAIGAFMFIVQFAKQMAAEKGLGEYHFKWGSRNLSRLRLLFRRLVPIYIPSSLILCLIVGESSPEHIDGLARLVALFTVIGFGTVFILFTKPELADETDTEKPSYPLFDGSGLFWFTIFVMAGLVLLLLIGFVVTTIILIVELQLSALAVYGAFVLHGMVLRWFEIKERRMALAETIAERRARQETAEEGDGDALQQSEELLIDEAEKDQGLSLVEVGEQMRNVIRFLVGVGLIAVLYYLWAKETPLLSGLATVNIFGKFSIADLAVTILAIGLTFSVTRNLPGLLEILVFRLIDVVPGTRTAITTLVQYAVITIGMVIVSRQLEIDWSQLGWIAAALSVGLGFGLQEVVANFVCGIILLFERPIRVGDVVTVDGVSGIVSRIQMRATTIINWDREELVVPNKAFITGSLLNMTLSTPINRVVIPVGVAYGSDTEKVLGILSEVARGTEGVMEDPAPVITFEAFGESSLDFSIRAYLPNRDNRLGVITELNRQIDARFAEAGIEIPFPQRDLHVRSVDEGVRFLGESKS